MKKLADRWQTRRSLADNASSATCRSSIPLTPVAEKFGAFRQLERELATAQELQKDVDPGMPNGSRGIRTCRPQLGLAEER